jgi:hypothetical protein
MKNVFYPAALLLSVAALTGCLFGNSSDDPGAPGEQVEAVVPYRVEGGTIITPAYTSTDRFCDGDALETHVDTIDADTVEFLVADGTFTVFFDTDTTASEAVVRQSIVYSRVGSGSGLAGLWLFDGLRYTVVAGTLTASEKSRYDREVQEEADRKGETKAWVRFADGKITSYELTDHAARFIREWNGETGFPGDSARFDIDVKAIDPATVELKGRNSGETVRLTHKSQSLGYSSDKPGHAPYEFRKSPTSCPNESAPDWYGGFLAANSKAIAE